ncbi:MAG: hypothetical protein PHE88_08275 [Elusimicrobia bacterium]|nr:hypothetical protein [Elusimicrobiota bacterium]
MECNKIKTNFIMLLRNELLEEEKQIIQRHIEECENCKQEYLLMVKNYNYLKGLKNVEPSNNFDKVLMSRLDETLSVKKKDIFESLREFLQNTVSDFYFNLRKAHAIEVAGLVLLVFLGILTPKVSLESSVSKNTILKSDTLIKLPDGSIGLVRCSFIKVVLEKLNDKINVVSEIP